MITSIDLEYRDRVQAAVIAAIVEASIVEHPGGRAAVMQSGEVIDALVLIIATLAASSEAAATPRGRREMSAQIACRIHRRMGEAREFTALHGSPFQTIDASEARPC